jgi:hypothetical protein
MQIRAVRPPIRNYAPVNELSYENDVSCSRYSMLFDPNRI